MSIIDHETINTEMVKLNDIENVSNNGEISISPLVPMESLVVLSGEDGKKI